MCAAISYAITGIYNKEILESSPHLEKYRPSGSQPAITGIAVCCACEAIGHAAAPPRSMMNSRRFMPTMGTSSPVVWRRRHRACRSVCRTMRQKTVAKRTNSRHLGRSASCRKRTLANLIHHLVGECEQFIRYQAERFGGLAVGGAARREDRKTGHAHARLRLDFSTRASACGAPVTGSLLGSRRPI